MARVQINLLAASAFTVASLVSSADECTEMEVTITGIVGAGAIAVPAALMLKAPVEDLQALGSG